MNVGDQSKDINEPYQLTPTEDGEFADRIDETDNDSNEDNGTTGWYGRLVTTETEKEVSRILEEDSSPEW
jgi:hypothetical protein